MLTPMNSMLRRNGGIVMALLLLSHRSVSSFAPTTIRRLATATASHTSTLFHSSSSQITAVTTTSNSGSSLHKNNNVGVGNRRNIMCFMSSSTSLSESDIAEIESQIKAKGDEIRQLKADGIDKAALAPHVEELLALKAKVAPPVDESQKKKQSKPNKKKKQKQKQPTKKAETEMTESELRQTRLAKVEAMREAGEEPYAYSFNPSHSCDELRILYDEKLDGGEEDEESDVAVAGRIMAKRVFGKLAFFTLQDESGTIQLHLEKKRLGDTFKVRSSGALPHFYKHTLMKLFISIEVNCVRKHLQVEV